MSAHGDMASAAARREAARAAACGAASALLALAACDNPHSEAQRIAAAAHARAAAAAASKSAAQAEASAAAAARASAVERVRRVPPGSPEPSADSGARAWFSASASSAEAEALAWAILEGQIPPGGLPGESYDPKRAEVPVPYDDLPSGSDAGGHRTRPPQVRMGATTITGEGLPPEVIQRIVRQNFGRFRLCYENGLRQNPNLQGRVTVRFVIDRKGATKDVRKHGSDLPDAKVVDCVVRSFSGLSFPEPEKGTVTVLYPISFSPGG